MEVLHAHLLGNQHVKELAPRLLCGHGVPVVEGVPVRMAREQERHVGDVGLRVDGVRAPRRQ
jgi:hypothetical protein